MALNFFGEGGLLNFYETGGAIAIRKTHFNSHKNHNPDCDILEGYIDDDSFITYCVYVKDATHGSKKGDESMEYYSGENYVPGSKKKSNSKHFTVSEIPAKYLAAWKQLKEEYNSKYKEESGDGAKLADGGKNWVVLVYDEDDKIIERWTIASRTEGEARSEAEAEVEQRFPDAADWTLTQTKEDGGKIAEGDYDFDKIAAKQRHDYHVGDKVVIRNEDFGKDIVTTITGTREEGEGSMKEVIYVTADGGDYLYTQIRGVVADEYEAGGRIEKNWIVRTYDEDNQVIEWWIIKNRTENEARSEAEAEIEQNFRDADDWTLTQMDYDDIKSDIDIFKGIVSDTEKIDDVVFAERFILENNLLSYDLNDDKYSSLRDLISVLKAKAKLFKWSLFNKKEQKELFDAAMLQKYKDYKSKIGVKYATGGKVGAKHKWVGIHKCKTTEVSQCENCGLIRVAVKDIDKDYDYSQTVYRLNGDIVDFIKCSPRSKLSEGVVPENKFAGGGTIDKKYVVDGTKKFNTQYNIGQAKYVVNYHDGVETHKDGSAFYDIHISNNKVDFAKFQKKLLSEGYVETWAEGGAVQADTLVEVIDILDAWEKYANKHDKDVDDIEDFNAYLNKEQTSLGAKKKQAAIREFAQIYKEDEEFATGGLVDYEVTGGGFAEPYKVNAKNSADAIEQARRSLRPVYGNVSKNQFTAKKVTSEKYVAVHENKDGYWTIASKPVDSKKIAEILAAGAPRGETGKAVTLKEAKEHKKVLGREYLEMAEGGTVSEKYFHVVVKIKDKLIVKKDFEGFTKPEIIKWGEERGWKYNAKGEDEGGHILKEHEFFVKPFHLYDKQLPKTHEAGGEVKPIAPVEHYRYLDITKYPNGLELAINDEGREEVKEWQEDEKGDYEIMGELFDTVQGNSEYMWHENLGDQGFGLTSAPGITDGYYNDDDNGKLTDKGQEDSAELYSFMGYELHSPLELLLRDGKVFFARVPKEGDVLDAKGVPVRKTRKRKKHETGGGIDDYFSDPDNAAAHHSYVDAHKDDEKEVKGLVLKNITKNKYVETEKNGKVILTKKLEDAMRFWKDGDESESDAEATLALLNEQHKDSYSLIETDDVQ